MDATVRDVLTSKILRPNHYSLGGSRLTTRVSLDTRDAPAVSANEGTARNRNHFQSPADWALAIGLGILGLACNFHQLAGFDAWYDEAWSFGLANQPLSVMWHSLWGPYQNMALYYVFLHGWLRLLELLHVLPTEALFRAPSAIFAAGSVVMVFAIGRQFWNRVVGIVAASFYMLSYLQIYIAQQARSYGLQMLLLCVAWYALLGALTSRNARNRWWACYVAAMTLAVYAHLWSSLILIAQAVALGGMLVLPGVWQRQVRDSLWHIFASLSAVCLLIAPIGIDAAVNGGQSVWLPPATSADLRAFFVFEFGGSKLIFMALTAVVLVGLIAAAVAYLSSVTVRTAHLLPSWQLGRWRLGTLVVQPYPGVLAILCWLSVPTLLSYAVTQPGHNFHLFYLRYLVAVTPAFALLVGIGVSSFRWRSVQYVLLVGVIAVALWRLPSYYSIFAKLPNYHSPAAWLNAHYQPGDGLACYSSDTCSPPMDYYLHAYPGRAHFDADSPGTWSWQTINAVPDDPQALAAYAAKHPHVCLLISLPVDPASPPPIQHWFDTHEHLFATESGAISFRCYDSIPG